MNLRPIVECDLEKILVWRNAPEVRKFMYSSHVISMKEHKKWFEKVKKDRRSLWYVFKEKEGDDLGVVYFTNYAPASGSVFWGFYASNVASPGVGTKMEFAALEHAFFELKVHKLNCEVLATNSKVINLHKKVGFCEEGYFRDYHYSDEMYVDVVRLGILKADWLSCRDKVSERIEKMKAIYE